MFLFDNERIEIDEPFVHDGVIYPNLNNLVDRQKLGVVEVDEPAPPSDYSEILYRKEKIKTEPYVLYIRREDEEIAALRLEEAKKSRIDIVARSKVTTASGKEFDADEISLIRMSIAISALDPEESVTFILANNVPTSVTREELREALRLGGAQFSSTWASPYLTSET